MINKNMKEMNAKIVSKKLVDSIASPTGKAYEIKDSWGNRYRVDFWPSMPEQYMAEYTSMQAVAAQSQIAMPDVWQFLAAKKNGVIYEMEMEVFSALSPEAQKKYEDFLHTEGEGD